MNTPSIDPFMGLEFEKSYSDIFNTEIDFQGFSLPHTPTRPSFSPKELVKGEEKSKNAKFPSVEHPIDKPMPVLIDSRTTPQDEVKIAESLNYQHPVGYVSKYAADQVLASRSEERAEPSTNESISCNKFDKDKPSEGRMKHAKVKLSAISTTEPSQRLFIPYLPENNDIKLAKIKKSIRELKKGIREYTKSEEYRKSKDGKKRLSISDFVTKNYIPQCRIFDLKMHLILYRQQYNEKLLKSIIQKLDSN